MPTGPASPPQQQDWPPPGGWTPPPASPPPSWFKPFGRADFIGLGVLAFVLTVLDATFMAVGRHSHNTGLFMLWFALQALTCVGAGVFQAVRRRSWQEIAIVGAIAAVLLAFIVLVMVNPDPGSADCGSQGPCDTSFGLGAIVIAVLTFPLFGAMAALGRAVARLGGQRDRTG